MESKIEHKKYLFEGKTDKEWITLLSNACFCHGIRRVKNTFDISEKEDEIIFYFDNNGNLLNKTIVDFLQQVQKEEELSENLKEELNISDDWEDNNVTVSINSLLIVLTMMLDREDVLIIIRDLLNHIV